MLTFTTRRLVAQAAALSCLFATSLSHAAEDAALQDLRRQIDALRQDYEARLQALEAKLTQAEQARTSAAGQPQDAPQAQAPSAFRSSASSGGGNLANSFNPAISLVLNGTYAALSKSPDTWRITGFVPAGDEAGPESRGFSLGESEFNFSANIDPWLYGSLTLAVAPDDGIEAEEAFIQSTALPGGFTLKAGRFFGGLGYLNEQHAHTWDFVDAPLVHQAFLGGQFKQDGVQARWLAPTDQYLELGAELGRGATFPGTDRDRNGMGAIALSAHTGGDVGDSHNWRAGLSWLQTKAGQRTWDDEDASGQTVSNAFSGRSRLWIADGVWKWAPQGQSQQRSFKLQGEYFRRTEQGDATYDLANLSLTDHYRSTQSGWYLQGIYQFAPAWRVGLRHDRLDIGSVTWASNQDKLLGTDHQPSRSSVMLDWSPSEFQRWRIQFSDDRARQGIRDGQFFLQYIVNLGAHGAHSY
ncbi:MAG: TonB-dependent receptor [Aquabacterium sp.]